MNKLPHVRQIIETASQSGAWNMAVDQILLQSAFESGIATLRWYSWEPTVSLGYFQSEAELQTDKRLVNLPHVRRLSGGGTLVHDHELTYSLSLPPSQSLITRPVELYHIVHQCIAAELSRRGANAMLRGVTVKNRQEPVLCFAREDEHDLVLDGHKILGSAQRRRRGAILQHGGLLLAASSVTPELLGLQDLRPRIDLDQLAESLGNAILAEIAETWETGTLTTEELDRVRSMIAGF
jgi:lipoate-protein ligase A